MRDVKEVHTAVSRHLPSAFLCEQKGMRCDVSLCLAAPNNRLFGVAKPLFVCGGV